MVFKPVNTKKDFVARFLNEEFGNRTRVWNNILSWANDGNGHGTSDWNVKKWHLRSKLKGGETFYSLSANGVLSKATYLNHKEYYVAEMADPKMTVIQGEVMRGVRGLELTYNNTDKKPMREALAKRTKTAVRIKAATLLYLYLPPEDYEHIFDLLNRYPGHVVEFSTYRKKIGTLSKNTIIWEVRNY